MEKVDTAVIGKGLELNDTGVDNQLLVEINAEIRNTLVEEVGEVLRETMEGMKAIV